MTVSQTRGIVALAGILAAVILAARLSSPVIQANYLVGAYYYGWYDPSHWAALDHVGRHLPQPLQPSLGEYNSSDPGIVAAHVQWAAQFGIDFFIVSWAGRNTGSDRQAREHLLPTLAQSTVRQTPMLELPLNDVDLTSPRVRQALADDLRYLGEHFLRHPSVLRVKGRPVLFLYTTRILRGDVDAWMKEVRQQFREMDLNPYIIADEVFWQDIDRSRIRSYDAVTAYNVYDWPLTAHRGWASQSSFFADVTALFRRWQDAAREVDVAFVPNAMPGYNDRGVRLEQDHFVIPRQMAPRGSPTGFFERSIRLAQRFVDPGLRMITITSFNEWYEWTQIEPAAPGPERASEHGPSTYTQGFAHQPYRFEFLQVVRTRLGSDLVEGGTGAPR